MPIYHFRFQFNRDKVRTRARKQPFRFAMIFFQISINNIRQYLFPYYKVLLFSYIFPAKVYK